MIRPRDYFQIAGMALSTLRAYKLRSGLTMLSVVASIATVIAISSVVNGLNSHISEQISRLGSDLVWAFRFDIFTFTSPSQEVRMRRKLTIEDAHAMHNLPHVRAASATIRFVEPQFGAGTYTVKYEGRLVKNTILEGVEPEIKDVLDLEMREGRWFTSEEDMRHAPVIVLGGDTADELFGNASAIGKEINVEGELFTIVGVMAKRRNLFGGVNPEDNIVDFPLRTFSKLHPEMKDVWISVKATSHEDMGRTMDEMTGLLRQRRKLHPEDPDDFSLMTQNSLSELWLELTGAIFAFMFAVSGVGLVVGGIGVMDIMLVSVIERTREIGVRKAVGAARKDVLLQFTLEAVIISGSGGLAGILVGMAITFLIRGLFTTLPAELSAFWTITAFFLACAIGLFFGIYPAWKAANVDPIVALRYD
jgi:putative ABC transport system permease protein